MGEGSWGDPVTHELPKNLQDAVIMHSVGHIEQCEHEGDLKKTKTKTYTHILLSCDEQTFN